MASEWQKLALGDLTEWSSGGTPPKSNPEFWGGDIPWISASSMKTGRLSESDRTLTPEGLKRGSRLARKGNVLLLVRGSELHKRIPVGIAVRDVSFNQDVKALCAKNGLDKDFLYHWLAGNETMLLSKVENTGIGAGKLDTNVLKNLPVLLPPRPEQRRIAHILGTLDDKIENNRKTAKTLEAMAQAIFQSWFVDFDPVRAKMAGESPESIFKRLKLTPEILNLFPDRLVDSELGEIPDGWVVGTLGNVAENPRRGIRPQQINTETPYIALEHMPRRCIYLSEWGTGEELESNKFMFRKNEILFGKLRPYFHKVGVAPVNGVCSTDIVVIAPQSAYWLSFVLGHTSSDAFVVYTDSDSTGTKMPRTSWNRMAHYEIALPPESIAKVFDELVVPTVHQMVANVHESRTLADLRDTLLPKLISGDIRVPEAEHLIENIEG